jgi:hypothetical protein
MVKSYFVKRKDLVSNLAILGSLIGVDTKAALEKGRSEGQDKILEAKALRVEYAKLVDAAKVARKNAENSATASVGQVQSGNTSLYNQADKARQDGSQLINTAAYFSRAGKLFGPSKRHVANLMQFMGKDPSVFTDMGNAGEELLKNAEQLEAQAEVALNAAQKAEDEAYNAATKAFNAAVAAADPKLAYAATLETAAAAIIRCIEFFS